jgi:hypothetical protein
MKWIVEGERSVAITSPRIASLTRPLGDKCLLGILAASPAVADGIFETIYSKISKDNMEAEDDALLLSSAVLENLRDESLTNIENFSVNYLENNTFHLLTIPLRTRHQFH